MTQKFFKGDLVEVGDMPSCMSHFPNNCKALVLYTYKEKYGGGKREEKQYCVYLLPNRGEASWYYEDQLTFVEADQFEMLPKNHVDRKVWEEKSKRTMAQIIARIKGI